MKLTAPAPNITAAKAYVGGLWTSVPTSVSPVGDYTTKLIFDSAIYDDVGSIVDVVNYRLYVPQGFRYVRVGYLVAWEPNATGWRGMRIKNSAGGNYGNVRLTSVGASASTNIHLWTAWLKVTSIPSVAPDQIQIGDYFDFWPAHTAGVNLICGADAASSWVALEALR